jgi:adenosine deaminase
MSRLKSNLKKLPKVDIHCHLDGSLRVKTVLELAKSARVKLPASTEKELQPLVQVAPTCRSLAEFLTVFHLLYPLLRSFDAVERIAYELVEDCAAENIRHVEARFAPLLQATEKFPAEQVVEAALKGLARGEKDFGVSSGAIICLFRSHSPAVNRKAFEAAMTFYGKGVVGLDVAGDEAKHPTMEFSEFFEEANERGMWTTCHAGETKGTENLRAALDLHVSRIGHGTHLLEDEALVREVVKRQTPLEIGLSSNVRTKAVPSLEEHPIRELYRLGVPVTLNTDDRGILGIGLTDEYELAASLGFSPAELARITLTGVDSLFMDESKKKALRSRFERELKQVLGDYEKEADRAPAAR